MTDQARTIAGYHGLMTAGAAARYEQIGQTRKSRERTWRVVVVTGDLTSRRAAWMICGGIGVMSVVCWHWCEVVVGRAKGV